MKAQAILRGSVLHIQCKTKRKKGVSEENLRPYGFVVDLLPLADLPSLAGTSKMYFPVEVTGKYIKIRR